MSLISCGKPWQNRAFPRTSCGKNVGSTARRSGGSGQTKIWKPKHWTNSARPCPASWKISPHMLKKNLRNRRKEPALVRGRVWFFRQRMPGQEGARPPGVGRFCRQAKSGVPWRRGGRLRPPFSFFKRKRAAAGPKENFLTGRDSFYPFNRVFSGFRRNQSPPLLLAPRLPFH